MEEAMIYPIVIHKDKRSDYGVTVPDLPGCYSAGSTLDEALAMAREAIELHLEGLIEEGEIVPPARSIEAHQGNTDYATGTWALVSVNAASLRIHAKRVNVSIPERVLDAVDRAAAAAHDTRSGLLTKAATEYLERWKVEAKKSARPKKKDENGRKYR
jgi:predicted RNase H-like HicB family nuclease